MEALSSSIERVRKHPGMYVGGIGGDGIVHMVLEVLANAYDQYLVGRCTEIDVNVTADGTITVEDNGPGIVVNGNECAPPLETLMTVLSTRPTVDGHHPHVHLGLGGIGIYVVNALSERFEIVTRRDHVEARAVYARGRTLEPITTTTIHRRSGTLVRFRPDPQIFKHPRPSRAFLTRELEDLTFLAPKLKLRWSFDGDDVAEKGLVGLVASRAEHAFDDVAHHRARYETEKGPVDVEVAVAWRRPWMTTEPEVDSFVNLGRTRGDGSHVDGLLKGARTYLAGSPRSLEQCGLIGAVSVVLADVIFGNPTRNHLKSAHVRGPVAEATLTALKLWESKRPELAAKLREPVESR